MIRVWVLFGLMAIAAGVVAHGIMESVAETSRLREELRERREFQLRRCEYEAAKALKSCGCAEVTP